MHHPAPSLDSRPGGKEEDSHQQQSPLSDDALEDVAGGGTFGDLLNQIRPTVPPAIGGVLKHP